MMQSVTSTERDYLICHLKLLQVQIFLLWVAEMSSPARPLTALGFMSFLIIS